MNTGKKPIYFPVSDCCIPVHVHLQWTGLICILHTCTVGRFTLGEAVRRRTATKTMIYTYRTRKSMMKVIFLTLQVMMKYLCKGEHRKHGDPDRMMSFDHSPRTCSTRSSCSPRNNMTIPVTFFIDREQQNFIFSKLVQVLPVEMQAPNDELRHVPVYVQEAHVDCTYVVMH